LRFVNEYTTLQTIESVQIMPKYKNPTDDVHVSVSFSLPMSIKEQMDRRIRTLRMSRTDYLKMMVLWELDKGEDAPFDMPRKPAPLSGKKGRKQG
jgi:hypothetical protein